MCHSPPGASQPQSSRLKTVTMVEPMWQSDMVPTLRVCVCVCVRVCVCTQRFIVGDWLTRSRRQSGPTVSHLGADGVNPSLSPRAREPRAGAVSCCPGAGVDRCPASSSGREHGPPSLPFCSTQAPGGLVDEATRTGTAVHFTMSTSAHAHPAWRQPHRRAQSHVQPAAWTPHGPDTWTRRINPHGWAGYEQAVTASAIVGLSGVRVRTRAHAKISLGVFMRGLGVVCRGVGSGPRASRAVGRSRGHRDPTSGTTRGHEWEEPGPAPHQGLVPQALWLRRHPRLPARKGTDVFVSVQFSRSVVSDSL